MDTIICPKCGTENPANTMNCRNCRINLQFALEHPDQFGGAKREATQREETPSQQAVSQQLTPEQKKQAQTVALIAFIIAALIVMGLCFLLSQLAGSLF